MKDVIQRSPAYDFAKIHYGRGGEWEKNYFFKRIDTMRDLAASYHFLALHHPEMLGEWQRLHPAQFKQAQEYYDRAPQTIWGLLNPRSWFWITGKSL